MLGESNKLFNSRYMTQTSNTFEAINLWIKDSNNLKQQFDTRLSDKECLQSCLTGRLPEDIVTRRLVRNSSKRYIDRYIDAELSQIDDILVRKSVSSSLKRSRDLNNLVFEYHDKLTSSQKSRVRIICKLIWFNCFPRKEYKHD